MHRRLWVAVITLMLMIGANTAVAAGFMHCPDELTMSSPAQASSMAMQAADTRAPRHQRGGRPSIPQSRCSVISPLSSALPAAGSVWTAGPLHHSGFVLVNDALGAAHSRPPLVGPPRSIS